MREVDTFWEFGLTSQRLILGSGLVLLALALLSIVAWENRGSPRYSESDRFLVKEAVVVLTIGAALVGLGVRQVWRWIHLSRHGLETEAVITDVSLTRMQPYARRRIYLGRPRTATYVARYTYKDLLGRTYSGNSGYLAASNEPLWKAGDRFRIRYDPGNPQKSIWLGRRVE